MKNWLKRIKAKRQAMRRIHRTDWLAVAEQRIGFNWDNIWGNIRALQEAEKEIQVVGKRD